MDQMWPVVKGNFCGTERKAHGICGVVKSVRRALTHFIKPFPQKSTIIHHGVFSEPISRALVVLIVS